MTRPLLLTYRTLGIGDLLTAVPALRGLSAAFPDHEHVLATPKALAPLVRCIDAVDRHLPVDELQPLPADLRRPELAVNLHGRGPRSHRVLLGTAPGHLLAFHHPDVAVEGVAPRWDPDEREVRRWCRLLEADGIVTDATDLQIRPPDGPTPPDAFGATIVHPGAKSRARRWPAERFAAVARHERRSGRPVLVTGSPDERALAEHVADLAGLGRTSVWAGDLDLGDLARTIDVADRLICGDTGVAHLATAVGTSSVALFGPMPPDLWGPPPELRDRHRVLWSGRRGDPLGDAPDEGLLDITVDQVLAELSALDRRGHARAVPAVPALRP